MILFIPVLLFKAIQINPLASHSGVEFELTGSIPGGIGVLGAKSV